MGDQIYVGTDDGIAVLTHANYVEFGRESTPWSGAFGELVERDGIFLASSGSDFPVLCNQAGRTDPAVAAADLLDAAEAWFAERNRGYSITVNGYGAGEPDVAAEAEARGLLRVMDSPAMVCEQRLDEVAAPAGIELREIDDVAGVADFVAINDAAYQSLGMPAGVIADMVREPAKVLSPNVHTVVAYEGGSPLACAQVLLSHGIAGVYWVGVVEAGRGRGLARLVTTAVTNMGFDHGAALVTLQASSMGEPVYVKMGYRELHRYTTYARFA